MAYISDPGFAELSSHRVNFFLKFSADFGTNCLVVDGAIRTPTANDSLHTVELLLEIAILRRGGGF